MKGGVEDNSEREMLDIRLRPAEKVGLERSFYQNSLPKKIDSAGNKVAPDGYLNLDSNDQSVRESNRGAADSVLSDVVAHFIGTEIYDEKLFAKLENKGPIIGIIKSIMLFFCVDIIFDENNYLVIVWSFIESILDEMYRYFWRWLTFGIFDVRRYKESQEESWMFQMQSRLHEDPTSSFNCIIRDDLATLKFMLDKNPKLIAERDACGSTIIHTAYLYQRYNIGRWLVQHYPKEALLCYSIDAEGNTLIPAIKTPSQSFIFTKRPQLWLLGLIAKLFDRAWSWIHFRSREGIIYIKPHCLPYTGENILHMTIIRRNLEETRWLLDFYKTHNDTVPGGLGKLLSANARGKSFRHGSALYFGGYPLHFAVCCNDVSIFDLVLSFASMNSEMIEANNKKKSVAALMRNSSVRFSKSSLSHQESASDSTSAKVSSISNSRVNTISASLKRSSSKVQPQIELSNQSKQRASRIISEKEAEQEEKDANLLREEDDEVWIPPSCDNTIYSCDEYGNNALHLCVKYGLKEMYSHITSTAIRLIKRELKIAVAKIMTKMKRGMDLTEFELEDAFGDATDIKCYPPIQTPVKLPHSIRSNLIGNNNSKQLNKASKEAFNLWLETEAKKKLDERMKHVLNSDFHSPITLAADFTSINRLEFTNEIELYKLEMLKLLLKEEKEKLRLKWEYGPMKSYSIDLTGIELPYNRNKYQKRRVPKKIQMHGVIEWLCKSDSEQGLIIPEIRDIVEKKWKFVGIHIFLRQFYRHLANTVCISIISFDPYSIPGIRNEFVASSNSSLLLSAYVIGCISMFGAAFVEFILLGISLFGRKRTNELRGAGIFEIVCRYCEMISFLIVVICKFIQAGIIADESSSDPWRAVLGISTSESLSSPSTISDLMIDHYDVHSTLFVTQKIAIICISVCVTCSWIYFYYFLMGYTYTAPFLLTMQRIVTGDMVFFFKFYVITVVAFGCSLGMITNNTVGNGIGFGIVKCLDVMFVLLQYTINLSLSSASTLSEEDSFPELAWLFDVTITLFYVIVCLMMLNLLIGMISDTYSQFSAGKLGRVLMEQYNILCSMDSPIDEIRKRRLATYAVYNPEERRFEIDFMTSNPDWITPSSAISDSTPKEAMIALLIVDPQLDFQAGGALEVPGSNNVSQRIGAFIEEHKNVISDIFVTLQSHHEYHISHPCYWRDKKGNHPLPETIISRDDIRTARWIPCDPQNKSWVEHYVNELQLADKLPLQIWPTHCVISSIGQCVDQSVNRAIKHWEGFRGRTAYMIMKGQNQRTDAFSVFEAEVEDPNDSQTSLNDRLLNMLKIYDKVLVCGHMLSHGINYTVRDLLKNWSGDTSRITLMLDGCSSMPVYEELSLSFLNEMLEENITITNMNEISSSALFTGKSDVFRNFSCLGDGTFTIDALEDAVMVSPGLSERRAITPLHSKTQTNNLSSSSLTFRRNSKPMLGSMRPAVSLASTSGKHHIDKKVLDKLTVPAPALKMDRMSSKLASIGEQKTTAASITSTSTTSTTLDVVATPPALPPKTPDKVRLETHDYSSDEPIEI